MRSVTLADRAVKGAVDLRSVDCLLGMGGLRSGSIDAVVTSPPYNIGIKYGTYKDDRPRGEYLAWIGEVGKEVRRVLKPDGSFFLNVGNRPVDPWIAWDVVSALRGTFTLQNMIHWIKAISVDDRSVGHYKPINSKRFLNDTHEFVFHLTRGGSVPVHRLSIGVPYQDKSNVSRWAGSKDLRCRGNVWFVPYETIQQRGMDRPHPATFPVKLAEMCLKLHGVGAGSHVLDPFLGLGSTAVAAVKLGASVTGFDVDAGYVAYARERVARFRESGV